MASGAPNRNPPPWNTRFPARTGQEWKLALALAVEALGSVSMVIGLAKMGNPSQAGSDPWVLLAMAGTLLGALGFAFYCVSVRCPRCRVYVIWHVLKTRDHAEANAGALQMQVCPNCSYAP